MSYMNVPIGNNAPNEVNVVVEIPKGSRHKYEYDEKLDVIRLDRALHSSVYYPTDYGFIPETRSKDGDHLDVMVLISEPTFPGCVLTARPVGILDMEDEAGHDAKILAVASSDPRLANIQSIDDVDEHTQKEIQHFFETYKQLENKWVKVSGWKTKDEMFAQIKEAQERFASEQK